MGYTVWPIANGNWSNAANWSGGSVPTIDDDVYLNGKTVTADQNMSCYTISTATVRAILPNMEIPTMVNNTSGDTNSTTLAVGIANASGNATTAWQAFASPSVSTHWTSSTNNTGWVSYQFTTGKVIKRYYIGDAGTAGARPKDWTFEGSNDGSSWTTLDTVTGAASAAYTSGTLANTTSYTYYRINITAVQTLGTAPKVGRFEMTASTGTDYSTTTNGSLVIPDSYNFTMQKGFRGSLGSVNPSIISITAGAGKTVNLVGVDSFTIPNYSATTGFINGIVAISSTPTVNVSGLINTNTSVDLSSGFVFFRVTGAATLNINTDLPSIITSTNGGSMVSLQNVGAVLVVNGNVIGQTVTSLTNGATAITSSAAATITINGNVIAGAAPPVQAFTSNVTVNGNVTAFNGANGHGITGSTGIVTINGTLTNVNNIMAVYAQRVRLKSTTQIVWTFQDELAANKLLYSAGAGASVGMPNQADVREGTVYGAASELEGTLIVPSAVNVRIGVPFDNTVGTGEVTAEDILDAIETSPDDLAVRLRNVATIQSTAATVAAYNG